MIFSCDKFSDLWEANIHQLEKYWADRDVDTYIITDKESTQKFENVSVLATGDELEFTQRLEFALNYIKTEYVFITLDDYFLIEPVKNEAIESLVDFMDNENFDYVRLFKRPKKATGKKFDNYPKINMIDTNNRYSVNLYVGIWRTDFMKKTVSKIKNIWQYEVSLYKIATELNAKCAVSHNNEFVILDVVRKGKILNKANRYLRKHNLYHGSREVQSYWYEIKLAIRTFGARHAPTWAVNFARNFMIKMGNHYFSQDE